MNLRRLELVYSQYGNDGRSFKQGGTQE